MNYENQCVPTIERNCIENKIGRLLNSLIETKSIQSQTMDKLLGPTPCNTGMSCETPNSGILDDLDRLIVLVESLNKNQYEINNLI